MTVLFTACILAGWALCIGALVWAIRTRHERKVWRSLRHDTTKTAIVLELEERVLELDELDLTSATTRQ
jgi:hypothetical protein